MAKVLITEQYLTDIADAIRVKAETTDTFFPSEMAPAIMEIDTTGFVPTGTIPITSNGTYNVTNYASAEVNVPTGSTINNQNKTVSPSTSQQTVTYDSGYTGLGTVIVNAMPAGTAGTPSASKGTVSNHQVSITPSVTNTAGYISGGTKTGTAVTVSASELVSGSQTVTTNDTYDVTNLAELVVDVSGGSVTWVTEYDGNVTIVADSPNYVVIDNWTPSHPTFADGQTWRVTWKGTEYVCPVKELTYQGSPVSYIGNGQIIGSTDTSNEPFLAYMRTSTQLAFATTDAAGTITLKMELQQSSSATLIEKSITANGTYDAEDDDADGYSSVTVNVPSGSPTIQSLSITPTTSQQTFDASGVDGYKPVTVAAMPTMTLPTSAASSATSGYTSKATIGRSTAAQYINIPPGYNSAGAYYVISAVANGSATAPTSISGTAASISTGSGTLTLTKTVSVTPTVSAGYVSSGTAGNSSVSLTANVTINPTPTASGATVTIPAGYYTEATSKAVTTMTLPTSAASSATSGYTKKATISRSTSTQYINIAPGYNSAGGYYEISAVANGSATGPSSLSGTSATVSTGTNTLTLTKTGVTTTPTVSAGYVSGATASTATVTLTASVTTKAAATYHPSTTAQTIAASQYLTGAQTIAAVTTSNLSASNILSGVTIKVGDSSDDDCVASVTGNVTFQKYYTGSSAPSSSLGNNGDIYLQE